MFCGRSVRRVWFISAASALLFLSFLFYYNFAGVFGRSPAQATELKPIFLPDGSAFECEVADSFEKRARGLMGRQSLCQNCCMLFSFEESGKPAFWMKETLVPLDLVFLDAAFTVVDVKEDFNPCANEPCEVYVPSAEAKYVVEMNAGKAAKHAVAVGSKLSENGFR